MAKKRAQQSQPEAWERQSFENTEQTLNFSCDALLYNQAARLVGPAYAPRALMLFSAAMLVCIIVTLLINKDLLALAAVFMVLSVAASTLANKWYSIQSWLAEKTNLVRLEADGRARLVITRDEFIWVSAARTERFKRERLRSLRATPAVAVLCFSNTEYVCIPRAALSESKYYELIKQLNPRPNKPFMAD